VRKPSTVIGRTTIGAIESGLFYGYLGMVEGLMRRIAGELGATILASPPGTRAARRSETSVFETVAPDITLHGLRLIWERKHGRS
jgi:type III pantothenate kinase